MGASRSGMEFGVSVFMDESGFTGANLLSAEQPVFCLASTILTSAEAQDILSASMGELQPRASEYKHSKIAKTEDGRIRVCNMVRTIVANHRDKVRTYTINKRFALLAKLIDLWIEPSMHKAGFNLYAEGGALAYLNMMWFALPTFIGEKNFDELLSAYERFARDLSPAGLDRFFDFVQGLYNEARTEQGKELLAHLLYGKSLGYDYLAQLGSGASDIASPAVFMTIAHWDRELRSPYSLIHDQSKNLESLRAILESLLDDSTSRDRHKVGYDARTNIALPFRAAKLMFAASEAHLQLQLCDLIAGADATVARHFVDNQYKPRYAEELLAAGIEELSMGQIWPNSTDIKHHGVPPPGTLEPLSEIMRLFDEKI